MTITSCQCIRLLIYNFVLYVGLRHISRRPSKLKTPTAPLDLCNTTSPSRIWMHGKVSTGLRSVWSTTTQPSNRRMHLMQEKGPRLGYQMKHSTLEVAMGLHVRLTMLIYAQRVHTYLTTLMMDANGLGASKGPHLNSCTHTD